MSILLLLTNAESDGFPQRYSHCPNEAKRSLGKQSSGEKLFDKLYKVIKKNVEEPEVGDAIIIFYTDD